MRRADRRHGQDIALAITALAGRHDLAIAATRFDANVSAKRISCDELLIANVIIVEIRFVDIDNDIVRLDYWIQHSYLRHKYCGRIR